MFICEICKLQSKNIRELSGHINKYHKDIIYLEEYYNKYINTNVDKKCLYCEKEKKFINISEGYSDICCSKKCISEKKRQTYFKKYGVINASQIKEVKEKKKKLCIEKYGVEYISQSAIIQEKKKKNCIEKYGVEYSTQDENIKKKMKETHLQKYGGVLNSSEIIKEKTKQTKKEKYNNENYTNREKAKQTCLNTYGNKYYTNQDKREKTNLERYGVKHYTQTKEYKEKTKKTLIQRYGVDHYTKSKEFKNLFLDKDFLNKRNSKSYSTKKKNNSFNTSKPEKAFKQFLEQNNVNFKHHYKSKLYPFNCDFYLPDKDLYIELHLNWTHGKEPFNFFNKEHIERLQKWKARTYELNERGKRKLYYQNAIYTWADLDIRKKNIAKKNNLNFITIYHNVQLEQFKESII